MNNLPSIAELRQANKLMLLKEDANLPSIDLLTSIDIDFDVYLPSIGSNLQREYCWSSDQQAKLIMSILLKTPIPHVAVVMLRIDEKFQYQIIDGKQRLLTLLKFYNNEISIDLFGSQYYFKDLPQEYKAVIGGFKPKAFIVSDDYSLNITDEMKIQWFLTIDNGTSQNPSHIRKLKGLQTEDNMPICTLCKGINVTSMGDYEEIEYGIKFYGTTYRCDACEHEFDFEQIEK